MLGCRSLRLKRGALVLQAAELAREDQAKRLAKLFAVRLVAFGALRLAPEGVRLARDFLKDVVDPLEIQLGVGELELSQFSARLEARHAGSFLHKGPPVQRAGTQELSDAPLLDDGVVVRAKSGAEEKVLHIAETDSLAVEDVLARAIAEQLPRDRDLAGGGADRHLGSAGAAISREKPL